MEEPLFLARKSVLSIHRQSLIAHGGIDGLRDPGLLDSALMQPEATYFYGDGDAGSISPAYAFHIAQNQPFLDGNKRTAIGSALLFLRLNGYDVSETAENALYDAMIAITERRMSKAQLAELFRRIIRA